ncbi:MAG: hypothetical protein ACLPTM_06390 [Steroidobacteraceae bacterium]
MSSRARRVLALTGVVTLHAGALLVLLAETRTRLVPAATATPALLVLLLSALEPQREQPRSGRSAPSPSGRALEKAPVHGDLFEHMHEPGDEGPSP